MNSEGFDIENEQKKLVLLRLRTLNPDSKIILGSDEELTVRELIKHVEEGDEFGKRIVRVQMKMLKVLTSGEEQWLKKS